MQDVKPALVSGEPRALHFHPAEKAHIDLAVFLSAPRTTPLLKLDQFLGAMRDEIFNDILFA